MQLCQEGSPLPGRLGNVPVYIVEIRVCSEVSHQWRLTSFILFVQRSSLLAFGKWLVLILDHAHSVLILVSPQQPKCWQ